MDTKYFFHFMRINLPEVPVTEEQALEIGEDFKKFLQNRFKGKEDRLEKMWDINPIKAAMNFDHPLMVNGYDPAFVLLFGEYVKEEAEKASKES